MRLEHDAYELRIGDCLDPVTGMASLADKSVDHVITDPPYLRRHIHHLHLLHIEVRL